MKRLYSISPAFLWMACALVIVTGTTPIDQVKSRGGQIAPGSSGGRPPVTSGSTTTGSTATNDSTTGSDTTTGTTSDGQTTGTSGFPWTTGTTASTTSTTDTTSSTTGSTTSSTTGYTTGSTSYTTGYTGGTTANAETPVGSYVEIPSTFGDEAVGVQVNDGGRVVGNRWDYSSIAHLFVWTAASGFASIQLPYPMASGRGEGINNSNVVAGSWTSNGGYGPFAAFFDPTNYVYSPDAPPVNSNYATLMRMSNSGFGLANRFSAYFTTTAAAWVSRPSQLNYGHIRDVPFYQSGDVSGSGYDMNNGGDVLAASINYQTQISHRYVALYSGGVQLLPEYVTNQTAPVQQYVAINDSRTVLGYARDSWFREWVVTIGSGGGPNDFAAPPQPILSSIRPMDINNGGDICGSYGSSSGTHPFLMSGGHFYDLAPLFAGDTGPGILAVQEAVSLNDNHQVLVIGTRTYVGNNASAAYRVTFLVTIVP